MWNHLWRFNTSIEHSRVDVSETFSADQLWFRILSGLFQRCSLPENLWTALKTEIFRAKNQPWNSAVSALIFSETALIKSWTALISSETALNSADFLWNSAEQRWFLNNSEWQFLVNFHYFQIFLSTSASRHIILVFSHVYEKKWETRIYFFSFVRPMI